MKDQIILNTSGESIKQVLEVIERDYPEVHWPGHYSPTCKRIPTHCICLKITNNVIQTIACNEVSKDTEFISAHIPKVAIKVTSKFYGKEVIDHLVSLGGKNLLGLNGSLINHYYYIDEDGDLAHDPRLPDGHKQISVGSKEMTVSEISEALGFEVKVVK